MRTQSKRTGAAATATSAPLPSQFRSVTSARSKSVEIEDTSSGAKLSVAKSSFTDVAAALSRFFVSAESPSASTLAATPASEAPAAPASGAAKASAKTAAKKPAGKSAAARKAAKAPAKSAAKTASKSAAKPATAAAKPAQRKTAAAKATKPAKAAGKAATSAAPTTQSTPPAQAGSADWVNELAPKYEERISSKTLSLHLTMVALTSNTRPKILGLAKDHPDDVASPAYDISFGDAHLGYILARGPQKFQIVAPEVSEEKSIHTGLLPAADRLRVILGHRTSEAA